ncbi:hypothetical protein BDV93DRAFT_521271 [Ceratobasidium sp. AG-I]|nr:hypothetical protein BDV93DRAFT_521271 [Ceratobasidium sp. AG-I]
MKVHFQTTLALLATVSCCVVGRVVNTTIYDTSIDHVSYGPKEDFCIRWKNSWYSWNVCEVWARPWKSETYRSDGRLFTLHRSLDHQLASVSVEFEGSAIWLYGPPRAQLSGIPPQYKICLHENHRLASHPVCYRVNVAKAYSAVEDRDEPVVIFAKGDLQYQAHRVVVSVADPVDNTYAYEGLYFSHAVYTIARPTPWPVEEDRWRFRRVVMHDTHPLLSYWPNTPVPSCGSSYWCRSGWTPRTYTAEDGTIVSWHELKSRSEWGIEKWGVEATFTAGAVAVYGIPKAHISSTDHLSSICVRIDSGPCEVVDLRHAYLNWEHHHESVLLWKHHALDPSRATHLSVRLMKTGENDLAVLPFKDIHYFESQEYGSPNPPVGRLEDITVPHDHEAIIYYPGRRCVKHFLGWCTGWYDPWWWREAGPSESKLTYRSTMSSFRTTEDPAIELEFQGSAVYVYGAPKSFIKDPFASQQICINSDCHIVDVEQAYLNAFVDPTLQAVRVDEGFGEFAIRPAKSSEKELDERSNAAANNVTTLSEFHPELEPVLIWSITGLDDKVTHKLRLALAWLPSVDNAEMSIAKVVYTSVAYDSGQSRPEIPIPQPDTAYPGPVFPPHAKNWAPRGPPPPLPSPSRPPAPLPPASRPSHNSPHNSIPGQRQTDEAFPAIVICFMFTAFLIFAAFCVLVLVRLMTGQNERQSLLSRSGEPPPPYSQPHRSYGGQGKTQSKRNQQR